MRVSIAPQQELTESRGAANEVHLPPNEVHVWWAGLGVEGAALCACWDLLSPEETRLASSYRFAKDRREFVVTRAVLRQVLAQYTDQPPAELRFDSGANGKPVLRGRQGVHFSVSHTSELAALAIARNQVGIDVEHAQGGALWQTVVDQCLSPRERSYVQALPAGARKMALYRCWTRKEAVLKALGTGLLYPPQQVSVLAEAKRPCTIELLGRHWLIRQVAAPRGYAAAVAIEEPRYRITWRRWKFPVTTFFGHRTGSDSAPLPTAHAPQLPVLSIELGPQGFWR